MNWLITSIFWYIALLVLGVAFIPLTKKIFGRFFFDFGYPFAKVLSLIFLSYSVFVFGIVKILPFTRFSLFLIFFIFIIFNLFLLKKNKLSINRYQLSITIFEEFLFLFTFFFWIFIRGQEPSIRGLEKFMDFGFINSILRGKYFPPLDMWLSATNSNPAGFPINYYYFGHLVGAFLIKLSAVKPAIGYNLILATLFALGTTQVFSLVFNLCYLYLKKSSVFKINLSLLFKLSFFGLIGSFIVNLGGNLHTIYLFTKGYPNEEPIPFWQILSSYNPSKYWYPNATRFIPFTIHEFPSYSYVVADLHGHVFDIPFVLLTLAILFIFMVFISSHRSKKLKQLKNLGKGNFFNFLLSPSLTQFLAPLAITWQWIIFLGFLTAVHYMTNAFDGPTYILLSIVIFFIALGINFQSVIASIILIISFLIYSLPFSLNFKPFVSGIGVNCSPSFLTKIGQIGPFIFEADKCQVSPLWMLFVLWGFFWINFILFLFIKRYLRTNNLIIKRLINLIFILFTLSTFIIIIPEFFYIKDIYPDHFRANTMFKLGYQAFIMMGIASTFVFFQIKFLPSLKRLIFNLIFTFFFFFVAIYPIFSIPSYYGKLEKKPVLDGSIWLKEFSPDDQEIIDYLNRQVVGQPVILEAQGDSYTDFQRISAYTGLPTVAGWWVHEWLWRGSPDIVGKRIPDIVNLYESNDFNLTKNLIKKYQIKYVIISRLEKEKYPHLKPNKFNEIGRIIFRSTSGNGLIYRLN